MGCVQLTFNTLFLQVNHQQFFHFDKEGNFKVSEDVWPELQSIAETEELCLKANTLLLIMQFLVNEENNIHIARNSVSKKSRSIAKKAANLNELLRFLNEKGYISFQYAGVYGRKQFITLNPKILQFSI